MYSTVAVAVTLCVLLSCSATLASEELEEINESVPVTCGSVIKLMHEKSGYRLHSHQVAYGSGSRQQSVTGTSWGDDPNSYWIVRPAHSGSCERGELLNCGSTIRLTHQATERNLHSHKIPAPLSREYNEVSGFGDNGEGNEGDDWKLVCKTGQWLRGKKMRLKHVQTGSYLHSHDKKFNHPIAGQAEVVGYPRKDENNYWHAEEGLYFPQNN